MAIGTNDYELTDHWQFGSNPTPYTNVYYYRGSSAAANAADLTATFLANISLALADILHTSMQELTISAFNLTLTSDFSEISSALAGVRIGEAMPSWNAIGYTLLRADRAFRNGGKRYGRVSENDVIGNTFETGFQAIVDAFATTLATPLVGTNATYELMIPKRTLFANPNPPPAEHYVLVDLGSISGVSSARVTHQVSRKT